MSSLRIKLYFVKIIPSLNVCHPAWRDELRRSSFLSKIVDFRNKENQNECRSKDCAFVKNSREFLK